MEDQFSIVQDWEGTRELVPRDSSQDGVMSPAGIKEVDFTLTDFKGSLSLNEMTVERRGIALFKTAQMPG